jgi:sarcosine oxidase subunit beta
MTEAGTKSDVLVIGGGIVGCSTALHLARAGKSVVLLDRERAGAKASAINFGGVRQNGRDLRELPISMRAARMWARIDDLIGFDGEFRQTGNLRFASPEKLDALNDFYLGATSMGLELLRLDGPSLRRRYPWIAPELEFGILCPSDGHANPRLVATAFAHAAIEAGAKVIEECAVEEAGHSEGAFVLHASGGRNFSAETLVNAAGAWGADVARWFGETAPIVREVPQMMVTEPAPYQIEPVLGYAGGDIYLRQTLRGNIVFGGGEGRANDDGTRSRPLPDITRGAARRAMQLVPGIRGLSIVRSWSGVDGDTPDGIAIIGPSATQPGLFHAFGFNGHGFQLGPAVGAVISELIASGRTQTDISALGIDRFAGQTGPIVSATPSLNDEGSG